MRDCQAFGQTRKGQHGCALLLLLCAVLLASCGPRDAKFNPSDYTVHGVIAPPDVVVPHANVKGSWEYDGLWIEGPKSLSCCWIATHATLPVRKEGPARTLVAGFWIPNIPYFAQGQDVTIALPGSKARTFHLDVNNSSVKIPLPSRLRNARGLIPVRISTSREYVPARDARQRFSIMVWLHLEPSQTSTDTRSLGAVLLYVYFR